jgi:uncharacterized membrane protein YbhN (UPF0104 family)
MGLSLSGHQLRRRGTSIAALVALAAVLQLAAGVGLAYVAGFGRVRDVLVRYDWPWLCAVAGVLALSFVGYYLAYRGIMTVEGGPTLRPDQLRAVVVAGFGGFLAHGGAALDEYAMQRAGADKREATVRVTVIGGLEHGILALLGSVAGIAVLVQGRTAPPLDFSLPWAVIPIPGFLAAFWFAARYRDRFRDTHGWRYKVGVFLDAIYLIRMMFARPRQHGAALLGMTVFWVTDAFAAWAALIAFGFTMNVAAFVIGYGTGMVFTRRTGPLGGAGILMVILPVTIWYSGAPLAVSVVGVFAYRVLTLWLPMPFSLAALPALRRIGSRRIPDAEGVADIPAEPALDARSGRRDSG